MPKFLSWCWTVWISRSNAARSSRYVWYGPGYLQDARWQIVRCVGVCGRSEQADGLVDATHLHGLPSCLARNAIPVSAILMPAGFFLSSVGRNREQPNGLIALLYLGVLSLTAGAVSLGIGLLQA